MLMAHLEEDGGGPRGGCWTTRRIVVVLSMEDDGGGPLGRWWSTCRMVVVHLGVGGCWSPLVMVVPVRLVST